MFEFVWPWLAVLIPLPLLMRRLKPLNQSSQSALKVPVLQSLPTAQQQQLSSKAPWGLWLVWLCIVVSLMRPQWLGEAISIPSEGRDLMIAVDLSGSMRLEDMTVNGRNVDRLIMIKYVLRDFISRRVGDRLGLILFADTAYQQTPLTYDRDTVRQLLLESEIGLVGDKTAIGDAIGLAAKRFEEKEDTNRVLILLTDGQNTAGNLTPTEGLELAKNKGITIYTIGVGADRMVQQTLFGRREVNPSKELDERMLSQLADQTGGLYFRARNTEGLAQIYQELDKLEPIARETQQMRPLRSLFHYPLIAALVLACLLSLPTLFNGLLHSIRKQREQS